MLAPAAAAPLGAGLLSRSALAEGSGRNASFAEKNLGARTYNICDFGAKGDGKTLDTAAVRAAIDACHKDRGGTVLVPAGVFVIGTVEMKSNVTLQIAADGTLLGSADGKQYHAAEAIPLHGDTTLRDGNVGLIYAVNAKNIAVLGPGTIDGQGAQFRSPRRGVPPPSGRSGSHRPYHLLFYCCKNLRVRDVFLRNSAFHSVRVIESRFVWMEGIRIYNRVNHNNDGFHFISSQYVHVSNCDVQSQDDACALFGSCRFVTITNSTFSTRWAVFRFGGGNPENVTVSNCVIYETYGCPIKMQFGPESRAQNILFSNLILQDVTGPISIDLNNRPGRNAGAHRSSQNGIVRNIMFNGIRARVVSKGRQFPDMPFPQHYRPGETRQCIVLNCVQESWLESVVLNDIYVTYGGGGTAAEARRTVPQIAGEYFEMGTPPAYGLYARRVRGLALSNVRFEVAKPDLRPAVVFDRVSDVVVNGLSAQGNPKADALLRFVDTQDALVSAARVLTPAAAFLRVEGAGSKGITIDGGDLSRAAAPVALKKGALQKAVRLRP
ncbi:MAG: right-handed parallel beta-helix repeat-containing protein [Acidobacteriota bacterium]|nr:right-handed parallel beta-helix repeat-containing protein [Acidobacteriota bacterium]